MESTDKKGVFEKVICPICKSQIGLKRWGNSCRISLDATKVGVVYQSGGRGKMKKIRDISIFEEHDLLSIVPEMKLQILDVFDQWWRLEKITFKDIKNFLSEGEDSLGQLIKGLLRFTQATRDYDNEAETMKYRRDYRMKTLSPAMPVNTITRRDLDYS